MESKKSDGEEEKCQREGKVMEKRMGIDGEQ